MSGIEDVTPTFFLRGSGECEESSEKKESVNDFVP